MKNSNKGFTLVELSIVLVIIGLIIGGVLTGRQIMQNAQITNAVNSIQAFEAQFQTYVQNYGALPGDDAKADTRFSSVLAHGDGNGLLGGAFDSEAPEDESRLLWSHLRGAGLIKGAGDDTKQPVNPFSGIYGFQNGAFTGTNTLKGNVICVNGVPGDAALAIDSRLDDGVSNAGNVMGMVGTGTAGEALGAGTVAASYESAKSYTLCGKM